MIIADTVTSVTRVSFNRMPLSDDVLNVAGDAVHGPRLFDSSLQLVGGYVVHANRASHRAGHKGDALFAMAVFHGIQQSLQKSRKNGSPVWALS